MLAAVGCVAFSYSAEHFTPGRGRIRTAAILLLTTAVLSFLVSGSRRRNGWLWAFLILLAFVCISYTLEWFGFRHRGVFTAFAWCILFGGLAGAGLRLFDLFDSPEPRPEREPNRWRPIRLGHQDSGPGPGPGPGPVPDRDSAIRIALADIASSPARFEAEYHRAAALLWNADRRAEALELLDEAVRRFPSPNAYLSRGRLLSESGREVEALSDFDRGIDPHSNTEGAYLSLISRIELLCKLGNYERALQDANRMVQMFPQKSHGYSTRADVHEAMGQHNLAKVDRARAQAICEEVSHWSR